MKARHFILNTALFLIIGCESKPPHTSDMIDLPDFKHTYTYEIGRQIDYALSEQGNDGREIRIWIIELV